MTSFAINPTARGSLPGSAVEFEPFVMRVLLDEELKAYVDMYQWMLSIVDYRESNSTAWLEGGAPKTILLHILDSTKEKILLTYRIFGAYPQTLGEIEFNYADPVNLAMYCSITFGYKYWELEKDGVVIKSRKAHEGSIGMHPLLRNKR